MEMHRRLETLEAERSALAEAMRANAEQTISTRRAQKRKLWHATHALKRGPCRAPLTMHASRTMEAV